MPDQDKRHAKALNTKPQSYVLEGPRGPGVRAAFYAGIAKGCSLSASAALAGISWSTFREWQARARNAREDGEENVFTEFFDGIEEAKAQLQESMLDVVSGVATNDEAKDADRLRGATWLLERRFPKDFGPTKAVELSGPGGGPVQVQALPPLVTAEAMAAGSLEQLRGLLGQVVELLEFAGEDVLDVDEDEDEAEE